MLNPRHISRLFVLLLREEEVSLLDLWLALGRLRLSRLHYKTIGLVYFSRELDHEGLLF
jgi:hypothetical protein